MTTQTSIPFEDTPLLTPERIATDPRAAFAIIPACVRSITLVPHDDTPQAAVLILGKSRLMWPTYSLLNVAAIFEACRVPGINVATNGNGLGGYWARLTVSGAGEDLTTINRFLFGASPYEQIVVDGIKSDHRPENLRSQPARKLGKESRSVLLGHVRRIAAEWGARGDMPQHLTAETYLANLDRLLQYSDMEASGMDVLGSLPLIPDILPSTADPRMAR